MFISDVRGDAIVEERNIPASCKSRKSIVNKNMTKQCHDLFIPIPMININIFGTSKNLFCYCWSLLSVKNGRMYCTVFFIEATSFNKTNA